MQAVHTANGIIRAGLAIWRTGQIPVGPPRGGGTTHTHSPTHTRARRTHISPDSSSPSLSAFRPRCRRGAQMEAEQDAREHVLPRDDECFSQRAPGAAPSSHSSVQDCALLRGGNTYTMNGKGKRSCHRSAVCLWAFPGRHVCSQSALRESGEKTRRVDSSQGKSTCTTDVD